MTRSAPLISQSALRAWMALGLASIACATVPRTAHGSEAAHAAPAASAPAAEAPRPAASRAAAKAGPKPILDPMEMLREKLAQKLGAARAAEAGGANVLRVSSKAEAAAAEPAHPPAAARPAVRAPKSDLLASLKAEKSGAGRDAHWSYLGSGGPESWATLKPEFAKCSAGQRQSPIDIRGGVKVDLDPVQFDYRPSTFSVIDNGHTVQVNVGAGNTIEVQGRRFDLVQFHFHRPSEERIDGRQFDMVAHLVHKDIEGRLAVVAVLLDRGSAHPLVQSVWNNLPLEKNEALPARGALDLNNLLPPDRRYYTYMGSLTTPPCSEGVLWLVMQQPVPVSGEQIAVFSRLYPMNARPIQSASGRLIKQSY